MKRIVYIGSDAIGLAALQWLLANGGEYFELIGVASGLDSCSGRGMKLKSNPIVEFAKKSKLDLVQSDRPSVDLIPWLRERAVDLAIVFAYGHILSQSLLDAIPCGFLNLHGSLLPELRGPSPIEAAILAGKLETGISLMKLVRKMDAGPTYGSLAVAIGENETAISLRRKVSEAAPVILEKCFRRILDGSLAATAQDESAATYCSMVKKEDGWLDFSLPVGRLEAQVRAYCAWPGSFFRFGGEVIRVGSAEIDAAEQDAPPGTVLGLRGDAMCIVAKGGILRCLELQRPTRKMLPARLVWDQIAAIN
ncbi:MAG: methionyl-tRNA formyltransferase [Puniceicoccales bacterium]|nr:methionyl-tRNA formyltransferase [Puniceicoccales bacterium]